MATKSVLQDAMDRPTKVAQQTTVNSGAGATANALYEQAKKANLTSSQASNVVNNLKQTSTLGNASNLINQYAMANNASGSSGGNAYAQTSTNYYNELMDLFQKQSESARQNAIDAIMKNLEAVKGTYNSQIQNVNDEYSNLIDQNEVKKYRTASMIRENQANAGRLDSGLGRQERLLLNTNYDNKTTDLQSARAKAVNDIYNLITQAEAEAETNKANINNQHANALLQFRLANL